VPFSEINPAIRPIEVFPGQEEGMLVVHDPAGLAAGVLTITPAGLFILSCCDGSRDLDQIRESFRKKWGEDLPRDRLEHMLEQLDAAYYLDSPAFATYYQSLVDDYRAAPTRVSGDAASYGTDGDGLAPMIAGMLADTETTFTRTGRKCLAGFIAPHLDYPRGGPCYADAYAALTLSQPPKRFVILGTNHFGQGTGPVATRKDFQTPLGMTRIDQTFLDALSSKCSVDLCEHELDHQREHSIELQLLILQQMFGADAFEIVPILCHDPCSPTGTTSYDGKGADLKVLADAIGEFVRADDMPTAIIAGADLSHVGYRFGDERELDADFLSEIERKDRQALQPILENKPNAFTKTMIERNNETRFCSIGCIYALMTAIPNAQPELLRYHQTADPETGTGVTSAAIAFWESA